MKTKFRHFDIPQLQHDRLLKRIKETFKSNYINKVPNGVVLMGLLSCNNYANELIIEGEKDFTKEEIWHRCEFCQNKIILVNPESISELKSPYIAFRYVIGEDEKRVKEIFSHLIDILEMTYLPSIDTWEWE